MELVLLMVGSIAVVLLVAWGVRRFQRDVDEVDDDEYGGPPLFHGQAGPH